jgi:hypothetical protein
MNPFNRKLALLLPALCLALPVFGAGEVLLTMDPDKGIPTFVDDTNNSRVMEFLSVNYQNPASPESFVLVFTSTFAGQYNTDLGRYTEGVVQANGDIWFSSQPAEPDGDACTYNPPGNGSSDMLDCHIVKIRLLNGPRSNSPGFIYSVQMGGGEIDPRVRPK